MMFIFLILFVVIIIAIVSMSIKQDEAGKTKTDNKPLDVVKDRYAKGEINQKEFDQKKKDLQ